MTAQMKEEKEMDSKKYRFEIAHVGINTENAGEAQKTAELLCSLFGFPKRETQGSCFVNEQIEVMKSKFRGTNGHIAVGTDDISGAKKYLESKGLAFDDSTENRDENGNLVSVYLKDEIAGFAFHLVQRKK